MSVFSLKDLKNKSTDGKNYDTVDVYGGQVVIASLSSADMIEWLESNEDDVKKKEAGLRLIVKSIIEEETKESIPEGSYEEYLDAFRQKDARENGKLVKAILILNGLSTAAEKMESALTAPKNDSSEVATDASPTVSA